MPPDSEQGCPQNLGQHAACGEKEQSLGWGGGGMDESLEGAAQSEVRLCRVSAFDKDLHLALKGRKKQQQFPCSKDHYQWIKGRARFEWAWRVLHCLSK